MAFVGVEDLAAASAAGWGKRLVALVAWVASDGRIRACEHKGWAKPPGQRRKVSLLVRSAFGIRALLLWHRTTPLASRRPAQT